MVAKGLCTCSTLCLLSMGFVLCSSKFSLVINAEDGFSGWVTFGF